MTASRVTAPLGVSMVERTLPIGLAVWTSRWHGWHGWHVGMGLEARDTAQ